MMMATPIAKTIVEWPGEKNYGLPQAQGLGGDHQLDAENL
jgi:hypothetical protein